MSQSQSAAPAPEHIDKDTMRAWIQAMQQNPRGPFARIRWFCRDGAVLPPEPYACNEHGGGVQHGEWSEQTRLIRAAGFPIANILADLQPDDFRGGLADRDTLKILLLEQFLIAENDGWILRKARFYRGAFQIEDESRSAKAILQSMVVDPVWREQRYPLLREAVRLLPHGSRETSLTQVRGLSGVIAEQDPGFVSLRNKIHARPDAGDAQRVYEYARTRGKPELHQQYQQLTQQIADTYDRSDVPAMLTDLANGLADNSLARSLREGATVLDSASTSTERLRISGELLVMLRDRLSDMGTAGRMLQALDVSIALELEAFVTGRDLRHNVQDNSRAQCLQWLRATTQVLYGMGLITRREWGELRHVSGRMDRVRLPLAEYRQELKYLSRVPDWAARRLRFYFGPMIEHLAQIEPLVRHYTADRLRGSPLLFYTELLDTLSADANTLSGIHHELFGRTVDTGLRSLNPGLSRGILRTQADLGETGPSERKDIFIVPETVADLPPVSGIITASEGNHLSHVQLLARNLGIPNVVVSGALLPELIARRGTPVVLAVSPEGVVQLQADGPKWDEVFARRQQSSHVRIRVDIGKLGLKDTRFIPISELRAKHSGHIVGPKAAHVGELSYRFPGKVSPGLVIPFGFYRNMLEQPMFADSATSIFEWMQDQYASLRNLREDSEVHAQRLGEVLTQLRTRILDTKFDPSFRRRLQSAMLQTFGEEGSYGVFVRSDTNVEDLPGFTGAGLNRTVPNVVGFEDILQAIKEVWASPFTERAFGWRQLLMDHPEHVYVSVLLHKSVSAEKSGVIVTTDIYDGAKASMTVVSNEGVGGAVEGQSAETLLVNLDTGVAQLMTSATAPHKRVLLVGGGSRMIVASGGERILSSSDLAQLIELVRKVPRNYPGLYNAEGQLVPADIEFGFVRDQLMLFQIRPFVQDQATRRDSYLASLDAGLRKAASRRVLLTQSPLVVSQ